MVFSSRGYCLWGRAKKSRLIMISDRQLWRGSTKILAFGVSVDLNSYSGALAFFVELEGTATNEIFTGFAGSLAWISEQRLSNHG